VKRSLHLRRGLGVAFALIASAVWSHEVQLETSHQSAVVVRLTYADGQPFAFESYELYRPGKDVPEQVGRTTAQGHVVFLPASQTQWRLKAFSADGHGVDQVLTTPSGTVEGVAAVSASTPRALLLASGLGIVFGLFGLVQLFARKKQ
jgi:nickel transport protein